MAAPTGAPPGNEAGPGETARSPRGRSKVPMTTTATTTANSLDDGADDWSVIRSGWCRAGDSLPRAGSLAWRALPADDPVRAAATAVADLDVADDVRRYGPAVARALAEVVS